MTCKKKGLWDNIRAKKKRGGKSNPRSKSYQAAKKAGQKINRDAKKEVDEYDEVDEINEASKKLNIPILGGNVSMYNSTNNIDIPPSIVIVMIGTKDYINKL